LNSLGKRSLVAALVASGMAALAFADIRVIEESVETTADFVVLPSDPPSSLVVTPCRSCKPLLVPTSVRSKYFIEKEEVQLAELKRELASRPKAFVHVVFDKKTGELRRLEAYFRRSAT
jgi:hypothetical protein